MIYSFYSFKGGVGRSMAMANVAEILYQKGFNVVIIDWDLEAPGLGNYFFSINESNNKKKGIANYIARYIDNARRKKKIDFHIKDYIIPIYPDYSNKDKNNLFYIHSGYELKEKEDDFIRFVRTFSWYDFYKKYNAQSFVSLLRNQLESLADYVLVDSRTGFSEIGGICTYDIADAVVMFCSPGVQNIQGTYKMASEFKSTDKTEFRNNRPLDILIIPSRIEQNEYEKKKIFKQKFKKSFNEFVPDAFHLNDEKKLTVDHFWDAKIPYVPFYAFEEELAVKGGLNDENETLWKAYNKLVILMQALFNYDIFLSYHDEDVQWCKGFVNSMQYNGVSIWFAEKEISPGSSIYKNLDHGRSKSKKIIMICSHNSDKLNASDKLYRESILKSNKKIIPILIDDSKLPEDMSNLKPFIFNKKESFESQVKQITNLIKKEELI